MDGIEHHSDVGFRPRRQALSDLATRQHGVVARRQVIELGNGRGAIQRAVESGRLRKVHPGVYAAGHLALSAQGRRMAAVLACGDGAVLSHRTAAALWGIRRAASGKIEVTVATTGLRRPGVTIHRTRLLPADQVAECEGMPVTSVARTLVDLAEVLSPRELNRAIEQAERLRIFDLTALNRVIEVSRGRHGLKPLIAAVQAATAPEPTRDELERVFVEFCRGYRIPMPAMNVAVEGFEVDALWAAAQLIVELDGWEFHRTRAAFERDRTRDAVLQVAGYRVLRVSWRWLERQPTEVAHTIRTLLQAAVEAPAATATRG